MDLFRAGLAVISIFAWQTVIADTPIQKPNVLFILSDDQRADTIAALGNPNIHTPNLDRLAQEGTVFTRHYYMGGLQGAVCAPSRAMLMSGRTLFRVKENLQGQPTWPEQFTKAGYTTFITGKWHNQPQALLRSFSEGKAVFLGGMGNPYTLPLHDISPEHALINKRLSEEHSVKVFADAAIEFIRHQQSDKPWLCYIAPNCPHDPRRAPQEYQDRANAQKPPAPANFLPVHPFNNGEMNIRDEQLAPWPRTPEIVSQHLADYYAYVEYMDAQIGRILDALRKSGQAADTLIVFSSDNGLAIGSHGLMGKQNLYDHSTHLPLIVAGPNIPRGQKKTSFSYLMDVFPTLGELCGVNTPEGSEGKSLVPVIRGEAKSVRDSVFTAYRDIHRAVRDDRWHLIIYTKINKTQLFDLQNDPAELKDLAGDPKYAGEMNRLTELLKDWQRQVDDTQPLTTDTPAPTKFDISKVTKLNKPTPTE